VYAAPAGYRFVQVTSNLSLPMMLMPAVTNVPNATVAARAVSGQVQILSISEGLFPFTVIAHDSSANALDGYGLTKGYEYTLRWESGASSDLSAYIADPKKGVNKNKVSGFCSGDLNDMPFLQNLNSSVQSGLINLNERGFMEGSSSDLTNAVLNGYQSGTHTVGDSIDASEYATFTLGAKQAIVKALDNRDGNSAAPPIGDTNHTAYGDSTPDNNLNSFYNATNGYYASGNGRRIIIAPITRPPDSGSNIILDFGLFLLQPNYPNGANNSWCAMYLGSAVEGVYHKGVNKAGLYALRLVQ
jgi:hypothetical protein